MSLILDDQVPHASRVRCCVCGSPLGAKGSVCHHCGKAMCEEHVPAVANSAGRAISRELSRLGLSRGQEYAYHCEEHLHVVRRSLIPLAAAGVAVAVLGVIVSAVADPVAGLVLMVVGAGLSAPAVRVHRRRAAAALVSRPPLPVLPTLNSVHVLETVNGSVCLDDKGDYDSTLGTVSGTIDVVMTLTKPDRERLRLYRLKYRMTDTDPVEFSAGFGLLRGEAGLSFGPCEFLDAPMPGSGLRFRGDVADHPLFTESSGGPGGQWKVSLAYQMKEDQTPRQVPIWIIPSLVPGSDRRTLRLDLYWFRLGKRRARFGLDRFDEIELTVPTKWGNVLSATRNPQITNPEADTERTIRWQELSPDKGDVPFHKRGRSLTLSIRFEKPITDDHPLTGRLRASFKKTISGLTGFTLSSPGGGCGLAALEEKIEALVSVDFSLSLSAIRYQDLRSFPDRSEDTTERSGPHDLKFPDIMPDYRNVVVLTNDLSNQGYYVKRVIENPPRSGRRDDYVNRYWDIAGRFYDGVYPIDFSMTLTGHEEHGCGAGVHADAGSAEVRMTVRGTHVDQEMEKQIADAWYELRDRTHDALVKGAVAAREAAGLSGLYHTEGEAADEGESPGREDEPSDC